MPFFARISDSKNPTCRIGLSSKIREQTVFETDTWRVDFAPTGFFCERCDDHRRWHQNIGAIRAETQSLASLLGAQRSDLILPRS
jgi:hypothetical protein